MIGVSLNLSGLTELRQALLEMPKDLQKRTLRRVLRKQSKMVLTEIKSVMPHGTAPIHLEEQLKVAAGKTTHRGAVVRDGVALPTRAELGISPDDKYFWPFALEYGHAAAGRGLQSGKKKKKSAPKDTAPRPYIRNSWDRKETMAANDIALETFHAMEAVWTQRGHKNVDTTGQLNRDLAASTSEALLG